jgi:hypothetical protein
MVENDSIRVPMSHQVIQLSRSTLWSCHIPLTSILPFFYQFGSCLEVYNRGLTIKAPPYSSLFGAVPAFEFLVGVSIVFPAHPTNPGFSMASAGITRLSVDGISMFPRLFAP